MFQDAVIYFYLFYFIWFLVDYFYTGRRFTFKTFHAFWLRYFSYRPRYFDGSFQHLLILLRYIFKPRIPQSKSSHARLLPRRAFIFAARRADELIFNDFHIWWYFRLWYIHIADFHFWRFWYQGRGHRPTYCQTASNFWGAMTIARATLNTPSPTPFSIIFFAIFAAPHLLIFLFRACPDALNTYIGDGSAYFKSRRWQHANSLTRTASLYTCQWAFQLHALYKERITIGQGHYDKLPKMPAPWLLHMPSMI